MDSELKARISEVVFQLATAEKDRLEAAGTFVELEELASEIGDEVTRQLMGGQLVDRSNAIAESPEACCPDCGSASPPGAAVHRQLESTRGELSYHEPSFYCPKCRRSFFPSGGSDGAAVTRNSNPQDD